MLAISSSIFVAAIGQSLCYGIYFVIFGASMHTLFLKSANKTTHTLFAASILLFLLITLAWVLEMLRAAEGFLLNTGTDTILFFANVSQWQSVARAPLSVLVYLLADCLMIYRCWIVWSRKWYILVVPFILECAYVGVGILTVVLLVRTGTDDGDSMALVNNTDSALTVILLTQNALLTSLIVWKLWRVHGAATQYRAGAQLLAVAKLVGRSGALFSTTALVSVIIAYTDTTVENVMADIMPPITGISFALIIIGVGPMDGGHTATRTASAFDQSNLRSDRRQGYPLQSITVQIQRDVDLEQHAHSRDKLDGPYPMERASFGPSPSKDETSSVE